MYLSFLAVAAVVVVEKEENAKQYPELVKST